MNLLAQEMSPYLRQHMDNPVEWRPWGEAALEKAQAENKPILLSIGYSACHWCHVMAHESFEDPATADLMNQSFVNIKVDREERPDIDALYQSALSLMGKAGGWPLTMFLTPDGKPFWGGTYFPPQPRHGMPSFNEVLRGVAESYKREKENVLHNVGSLSAALEKLHAGQPGEIPPHAMLEKAGESFLPLIDRANGGIGTAPKFPNLPILGLLWDCYIRTEDDEYKFAVIHSLAQMCQGGIYDHLGGGISRYATDEEWLVPHFEKMLTDNALLIALLTEVYKETKHPLFARRVEETIGWVQNEMTVRNLGGTAFAASQDADSGGEEGKYYVWTSDEIDAVLGKDAEEFKKIYDVTKFGNWESVNILNRLKNPDYLSEKEEEWLATLRKKLEKYRRKRPAPERDGKVLADGNGLMISALARAGDVFSKPAWVDMAENAFRFVTAFMTETNGALRRVWCAGKSYQTGLLEDYANMAEAALCLYEVTTREEFLAQATIWADILKDSFWDTDRHGYFMTPLPLTDLPFRPKSAYDTATPSGNGTMTGVLARLFHLTGDRKYEEVAEKTAQAFFGEVIHNFFPFATLLRHCEWLLNPVLVMILSPAGTTGTKDFRNSLRSLSIPSLVVLEASSDYIFPSSHPFSEKACVDGKTTAYVCAGRRCLPPVTQPRDMEQLLRRVRHRPVNAAANEG